MTRPTAHQRYCCYGNTTEPEVILIKVFQMKEIWRLVLELESRPVTFVEAHPGKGGSQISGMWQNLKMK